MDNLIQQILLTADFKEVFIGIFESDIHGVVFDSNSHILKVEEEETGINHYFDTDEGTVRDLVEFISDFFGAKYRSDAPF